MRFVACVDPLDSLLGSLRGCLDRFPDKCRGMNTTFGMGDIGMAAFSMFFMQSPSFLAHQRRIRAGAWPLQLRQFVRHCQNPQRQSHSGRTRSGLDGAVASGIRSNRRSASADRWRTEGVPPPRRACADRARRHGVSLLTEDPLPALLDPGQRQEWDGIYRSTLAATLVATGHDKSLRWGHPAGAGIHRPAGLRGEAGSSPASRRRIR